MKYLAVRELERNAIGGFVCLSAIERHVAKHCDQMKRFYLDIACAF